MQVSDLKARLTVEEDIGNEDTKQLTTRAQRRWKKLDKSVGPNSKRAKIYF